MPAFDGYTLARTLRIKGWKRGNIAIAAHSTSGDVEKCVAKGCSGFVSTSIDRLTLIRACEAALGDRNVA